MESFSLVIFGITSNLAQIKLIPTLYDLVAGRHFDCDFQVIGIGRSQQSRAAFKAFVGRALRAPNRHHTHPIDVKIERELLAHLTYLPADLTDKQSYLALKTILDRQSIPNRMFYLATFPSLYASIFHHLHSAGLTDTSRGWSRLLIEKPIGTDRDSARAINALLTDHFTEDQIFRLDHYLGKETLQNILTFRFGNGLLEPLINSRHLDHIQVTAAEDFGIGLRGSYYDQNGALKDVGQNHLLQMIALSTMDAPPVYSNQAVTANRVAVLRALTPEPETLITGQYAGYHDELHVAHSSRTETFFAFRTHLQSTRFRDVPIYVRGGKYLARTATEIALIFKNSPTRLFSHLESGLDPSILIYRLQPNEGIVLRILTKIPGHTLSLQESYMQYCYPRNPDLPDAYERLIIDALRGDQTFFNDAAEIDAQWAFTDPLVSALHSQTPVIYPRGSWGPPGAEALLGQDGRCWYEPSTAFCAI